jgi:O-antigen ligase
MLTGRLLRTQAPRRNLALLIFAALPLFWIASVIDLKATILEALGRDPTLTGRTRIWEIVRAQNTNPLVGGGFMMFWDTAVGASAIEDIGADLNTAHNGYLEMYLDGGLIGESLLIFMLICRGKVVIDSLVAGKFGRMGFIFFCVGILYNFSESIFFRRGPIWFILLMAMISVPQVEKPVAPAFQPAGRIGRSRALQSSRA